MKSKPNTAVAEKFRDVNDQNHKMQQVLKETADLVVNF